MILDELFDNINKGRQGKSWGFGMGLPRLENVVDGITQGTYTLLFAGSGIGN